MITRGWAVGLIAAPLLLVGCAANPSGDSGSTGTAAAIAPMAAMSMAPGQTMATGAPPTQGSANNAATSRTRSPSATATMVCSNDIKDQVRTVLKLTTIPLTHATWADQLYTCTYTLPQGPMVLSVKQSPSNPAALAYFTRLRAQLAPTDALIGLGQAAYATSTGIAVVIKDNMTLKVDTTGLPAVFGPQQQHRTDLAYEIASDVLGCWTGG